MLVMDTRGKWDRRPGRGRPAWGTRLPGGWVHPGLEGWKMLESAGLGGSGTERGEGRDSLKGEGNRGPE